MRRRPIGLQSLVVAVVGAVGLSTLAVPPTSAAPPTAAQERTAAVRKDVQQDPRGPGHRPSKAEIREHQEKKAELAEERVGVTEATGSFTAAATTAGPITSSGPLTSITTSTDLNCAVRYAGDTHGEFYGDTACGTFASVNGVLYGPASVPAGGSAAPRTGWTPVSQDGPVGAGTPSDPYVVTTVVEAGGTGVRLSQTDTYVTGQNFYRTEISLQNQSGAGLPVRLWRAADCYLGDSDYGYGAVNSRVGSIGCRQGSRLIQWQPLTSGSHYYEAGYNEVWTKIGAQQAFPDLCARCTEYVDNGAGLSWDVNVPAGGQTTIAHRTNFTTTLPALDLAATFGPDCTCDSLGLSVNLQYRTARPINTATGAESEAFRDASYPGPGIPFTFTRFYTSLDTTGGPFGVGWTFAYNSSLTEGATTGEVDVRAESGAHAVFTRNADGTYAAPPAVTSTLARTADGWVLTAPDGHTLEFDAAGQVSAIKDRSGMGVTVAHDAGRLASVTDAAGRTVTFTWTGDRITRMTLADGRRVVYGYTDGRLTSVTDLRGKTTELAWDPSGKLASVKDPRGSFLFRNTYDPVTGRVTEQLDPLGNRTTFGWDAAREIATRTDARGKTWTEYYAGNVLLERDDPFDNAWLYDYDRSLNLTSVTDPRGNTTTYTYDAQGHVTSEIGPAPSSYTRHWTWDPERNLLQSYRDRNDGTTTYTYTPAGLVETIETPDDGITRFTYNAHGQPETRTTPRGKVWRFGYDADGNLASETSPLDNLTTYRYDPSGRRIAATTPRGNVAGADPARFTTTWTYDDADQVVSVYRPAGGTVTYGYDDAGNVTSLTDGEEHAWSYTYDAADQLVASEDPLAHRTTLEYDSTGNVSSHTTPAGTTTYGYDGAGRLISLTTPRGNVAGADPSAHTWSYTYNAVGLPTSTSHTDPAGGDPITVFTDYDELNRPVTVTDPLGHQTKTGYDPEFGVASVENPLGDTVSYGFDGLGRITSTKDGRGKIATYEFDPDGNRTSATLPGGQSTRWAYDDDGRLASTVEARGNVTSADADAYRTTFGYDEDANLTEVRDPLGGVVAYEYDAGGHRTVEVDQTGGRTTYAYDRNGRTVAVTDALGSVTAYGFDAAGRLTTRTDARDALTRYDYDDANRLTGITTAEGRAYTYAYDADGHLSRVVTALGNAGGNGTITVGYDSVGRRTGLDYSDGTPDESFAYDRAGRLVEVVDGAGTTTLAYDEADRLVRSERGPDVVRYAYDPDGRVTERVHPDGSTFGSAYDVNGWLASVTDAAGTTEFGYDPAGHLTSRRTPDNLTATSTWDAAGRLTTVAHTSGSGAVAEYGRTLDAQGRPVTQYSDVDGARTSTSYLYDAAGRLTSECGGVNCDGASQRSDYTYDPVGNRTEKAVAAAGSTTYAYDADGRMLNATAGSVRVDYEYDANGNQLTGGEPGEPSLRYTFDLANRLTRVQRTGTSVQSTGMLAGGDGHSLAVQSDGSAWAFGGNAYGQLGLGHTTSKTEPTRIPGIYSARAVAAGGDHSLVLDQDGAVYGFGDNANGQSADAADRSVATPTKVAGLVASALAAGNYHSLAVREDGTVAAWGLNNAGQLGDGTVTSSSKPVTVDSLTDVTQVAAGGLPGWAGHSLALRSDGTVWAWGYGKSGQLGDGQKGSSLRPVKVFGLTDVTAVAAAGDTSYALKSDGTVWAWGANAYGQLGNTASRRVEPAPVKVALDDVESLAAGGTHALAVRDDGTVWAWGNNNTGQLGDGAGCGKTCTTPVRSGTVSDGAAVGAGYVHSLAALVGGTGLGWGRNAEGQLGNGATMAALTPTPISGLADLGAISTEVDTTYTYDASGLRAIATDGSDVTRYTWDTTKRLPTLLSDGSANYTYDQSKAVVSSSGAGGPAEFFRADPLGSVRMSTGADGSVASTAAFDAFGVTTAQTGATPAFGFAGQETDPSGLQYMRARYYDPTTGRFLSTDPVAPGIDDPYVSAYVYANNNPTTFTDPSGQCLIVCAAVGAVAGAVVGGVGYAVTTDDFSWGGLAGAAGTGAVVGGVVGFTGGAGIAAGGAVASGLGLGTAGTAAVTAAGGAIGTTAGHYAANTALGIPYTGTDAVLDVVTGGLAGGFAGAFSSLSRANQLRAAADECLPAVTASRPSSAVLGSNLQAAGVVRPTSTAAHHIVAGSSPKASQARAVLQRFGIDINDAGNGVFLPGNRTAPNPSGAAVHSTTHTDAYYAEVNQLLGQATTRSEALDALNYIRTELLSGGFP